MKIITLHCDFIRFKALKKALKSAEEAGKDEKEVKEPLVVLTAVEKGDSAQEVAKLVESVTETAKNLKAKHIVLYPYAHLSSKLAAPELAQQFLVDAEALLSKRFKVTRAPFGYYKTFELKCKGHPLSELSKEFVPNSSSEDDPEINIKQLLKEISRSKLDTHKLKENDHRILGQKLDLFSFNEAAPGSIFWHGNGLIIMNEMKAFIRKLLEQYGYDEIQTPQILDNKLWKVSGHWKHFKDNMFIVDYENRDFGVKPMNCPGCMLVYKSNTRSYKDLPLRLAEFGIDHRKELSGVLSGLFRLVQFTQDDAHIFCTKKQIQEEVGHMLEMVKIIYKDTFGFEYDFELSTRPKKFMGEKKDWDDAEKTLQEVLKKSKAKFKINKGDGAFYGPKIDISIKDSLNRKWQCATIQLDMQMPSRFEIKYKDKDNKEKTPFVIHRAILGSFERFIGVLLEHTSGNLPVWLSPTQVRIISFTDIHNKSVEKLGKYFKDKIPNLRIDLDLENTTVGDKVRTAELQKIPYIIVIGDKEEKSKTLAIRERGKKPNFGINKDKFIEDLQKKIDRRS